MRIAIYSDLHLDVAGFSPPAKLDVDVVVLAGDIHCPGRRVLPWARRASVFGDRPIVQVAGNHEFYGSTYSGERHTMREAADRLGGHFLDASSVVIEGVRFLGCTLWTDFNLSFPVDEVMRPCPLESQQVAGAYMNDYRAIRHLRPGHNGGIYRSLLRPSDTAAIHRAERAWLVDALLQPFEGPTVVVTHHAPHRGSLAPHYARDLLSAAYVTELPEAFFEVPAVWVHGHTHDSYDYRVGACRVVCNPRGYLDHSGACENEAFDPCFVVEV